MVLLKGRQSMPISRLVDAKLYKAHVTWTLATKYGPK